MKYLALTLAAAAVVTASPLDLIKEKRAERDKELRQKIELEQRIGRMRDGWKLPQVENNSRVAVPGATITGRVVDESGYPVSYYGVDLFDEYGHYYGYMSRSTIDGTFEFSGLYPGRYTVREDYNDDVWLGNTSDPLQADFVTVAENGIASLGDIVQSSTDGNSSSNSDTVVVRGTLTLNGTPYAGRSFRVYYPDSYSGRNSSYVTTDETGRFEAVLTYFTTDSEGYLILGGDAFSPVWHDGSLISETVSSLAFTDTLSLGEITVTSGGTITGKVTSGLGENGYCYFSIISEDGYEFGSDDASGYGDSSFTVSGLPAGNYYVKAEDYYDFVGGFYPNESSLENAQLVTVTAGEVTLIEMPLTPKSSGTTSGEAYVVAKAFDSNGTQILSGDLILEKSTGGQWWSDLDYVATVKAGESFSVTVRGDDIYSEREKVWNEGKDTSLADGDTLFVTVTLGEAGRIAGSMAETVRPADEFVDIEQAFILSRDNDSYIGEGGYPFADKYEVPSAKAGTYTLRSVPFIENESGKALTQQLSGAGSYTMENVVVSNNKTTVVDFNNMKSVSGMISGSYTFNGTEAEWVYYAVNPDGSIAATGFGYMEDADTDNRYHGLLYRDWDVWSYANNSGSSGSGTVGAVDIPLLASGDYYIYLIYWTDYLRNESELYSHWYGMEESGRIPESEWEEGFEDGSYRFTIPTDAKKVTLATDNTWIKDLNLGSTPIADAPLKNDLGIRAVAALGKEIVMSYNFTGSDLKMNIYAANGRILASKALDSSAKSVQWNPQLATGNYLFEVVNGAERFMYKISLK